MFYLFLLSFWVRLVRLIGKNGAYGFGKGVNYKNKIYNNYKLKKKLDPGGPGSPLGSVLEYISIEIFYSFVQTKIALNTKLIPLIFHGVINY